MEGTDHGSEAYNLDDYANRDAEGDARVEAMADPAAPQELSADIPGRLPPAPTDEGQFSQAVSNDLRARLLARGIDQSLGNWFLDDTSQPALGNRPAGQDTAGQDNPRQDAPIQQPSIQQTPSQLSVSEHSLPPSDDFRAVLLRHLTSWTTANIRIALVIFCGLLFAFGIWLGSFAAA